MTDDKLPKTGKKIIAELQKRGFRVKDQKGSHVKLMGPNGKGRVIIPKHGEKDIPKGTLNNIEKQVKDAMSQQVKNIDAAPKINKALEKESSDQHSGKASGKGKARAPAPQQANNKSSARRKGR
ncbi:type II toxin-antitoxin system HicA family toxin [Nocardiopsis synnemataformans]|uniref:type II toxin-antitoxin system HicA family toxin n=1 Tax=Nocardiopsis synnemataformans TaxID=61305 RepID=UPI003EBADA63